MSFGPKPMIKSNNTARLSLAALLTTGFTIAMIAWFSVAASQFQGWRNGLWSTQALPGLIIALCWALGSFSIAWLFARKHVFTVCLALTCVPILSLGAGPICIVTLALFSMLALGDLILRRSLSPQSSLRDALQCITLGLSVYVMIFAVLVRLPINNTPLHSVIWFLPIVLNAKGLFRLLGVFYQRWNRTQFQAGPAYNVLLVVSAFLIFLYAVAASLPDVSADANAIYYPFSSMLTGTGRVPIDLNWLVFSPTSLGILWPLLSLESLGGGSAKLMNFAFLIMLLLFIFDYARLQGGQGVRQLASIILFLCAPVLLTITCNLHSEIGTMLLVTAGCLTAIRQPRSLSVVLATGIILGAAVAAKLTVIIILAPLLLLQAWSIYARKSEPRALRIVFLTLAFAVASAPPYLISWIYAGNPFFPLMNHVFHAPGFPTSPFKTIYMGLASWKMPMDMLLNSGKYNESGSCSAGFQYVLLCLPAAVGGLFSRLWAWRLFSVIFLVFALGLTTQSQYIRYFTPIYPLGILLILHYMRELGGFARWSLHLVVAGSILLSLGSIPFLASASWSMRDLPLNALSDRGRNYFRRLHLPETEAVQVCAKFDNVGKILHLDRDRTYHGASASRFVYNNWYATEFCLALTALADADAVESFLTGKGITHLIYRPDSDAKLSIAVQNFVQERTGLILSIGPVQIRDIRGIPIEKRPEQIKNGTFTKGAEGWNPVGKPEISETAGGVMVDSANSLYQVITPLPATRLRFSARLVSSTPAAMARLQINWHDKAGVMLKPDIQLFQPKAKEQDLGFDLTPPSGSNFAILHVMAHGPGKVQYLSVSLR